MWVNDNIVSFYFEYLTHKDLCGDSTVLFLKPAIVQCLWLLQDTDSLRSALPAGMNTKEIIFMPINDGDDDYVEGGNGSHWSLLVYSNRPHPSFHYYDSAASFNYNYAVDVKHKLELFMRGSAQSELPMVTHSCPQQENGTDCGIFVIMFADLLARRHADPRMLLSSQALSPRLPPLPSQLPLLPPRPVKNQYEDRQIQPELRPDCAAFQENTSIEQTASTLASTHNVYDKASYSAFTRIPAIDDRTFWWIEYGDLYNPQIARKTLLRLVNEHCVRNNVPLV